MIALQRMTAAALILALLAACSDSPRHVPPVAKTNPEPRERYEIIVELVDPPPGIQGISGMANFSIPDVICMRSPDPIAGYTPGSHYEHPFELEPIGDNTYRGHVYLDWPIDEDYYGLGVCKWKLHTAVVRIEYPNYIQKPDLWGRSDFPSGTRHWWCRRPETERIVDNCSTPSNPAAIEKEKIDSYLVILSASRDTQ